MGAINHEKIRGGVTMANITLGATGKQLLSPQEYSPTVDEIVEDVSAYYHDATSAPAKFAVYQVEGSDFSSCGLIWTFDHPEVESGWITTAVPKADQLLLEADKSYCVAIKCSSGSLYSAGWSTNSGCQDSQGQAAWADPFQNEGVFIAEMAGIVHTRIKRAVRIEVLEGF